MTNSKLHKDVDEGLMKALETKMANASVDELKEMMRNLYTRLTRTEKTLEREQQAKRESLVAYEFCEFKAEMGCMLKDDHEKLGCSSEQWLKRWDDFCEYTLNESDYDFNFMENSVAEWWDVRGEEMLKSEAEEDVDEYDAPNVYPYKECSACYNRKSCGSYNPDKQWFCEECREANENDDSDDEDDCEPGYESLRGLNRFGTEYWDKLGKVIEEGEWYKTSDKVKNYWRDDTGKLMIMMRGCCDKCGEGCEYLYNTRSVCGACE